MQHQTASDLLRHYSEIRRRLNTPPRKFVDEPIRVPCKGRSRYDEPIGPTRPAFWFTTEALNAMLAEAHPETTARKVKRIIREVAEKHGVTPVDILSERRTQLVVNARQEAMWRAKSETEWSLPRIGKAFGGRDHTTVIHALRTHEKRMGQP